MVKDRIKILGICILIGCIFISGAIVFNAVSNRYYYTESGESKIAFDKLTGTVYINRSDENKIYTTKVNLKNKSEVERWER